jgi:hypothetical protein
VSAAFEVIDVTTSVINTAAAALARGRVILRISYSFDLDLEPCARPLT